MEPGNNIIYFDGECNFCNSSINFIIRHDHKRMFKFAKLNGELAKKVQSKFNINFFGDTLILVQNETIYQKSEAVLRILKEFKGGWEFIYYCAALIPSVCLNSVYNLISKNRNRLVSNSTCYVYSKSDQLRFIE